jgi:hypothetical protein
MKWFEHRYIYVCMYTFYLYFIFYIYVFRLICFWNYVFVHVFLPVCIYFWCVDRAKFDFSGFNFVDYKQVKLECFFQLIFVEIAASYAYALSEYTILCWRSSNWVCALQNKCKENRWNIWIGKKLIKFYIFNLELNSWRARARACACICNIC